MDVVDTVSVPGEVDTIAKAYKYVKPILAKYGYQVDRQNFGVIDFSEKLINAGDRYLNTVEEVLALATIPKVLKKGIEIGGHTDHKGRGKSTKTFGTPVFINEKRGNVGVVVNLNKNKYYTHRIIFPNGSSIVLEESKKI